MGCTGDGTQGFCTWSPRLDRLGTSVRGIAFCRELVNTFRVHLYDSILGSGMPFPPPFTQAPAVLLRALKKGGGTLALVATPTESKKASLQSGVVLIESAADNAIHLRYSAARGQLDRVRRA